MTYDQALQTVLNAAVELWARDTRHNSDLREAITVISRGDHYPPVERRVGALAGITDEDERA